ncbi:MAG: class I SAM-dependent methyltransferase, partial [Myxococcales bacterium]
VEPKLLEVLRARLASSAARNVTPVLALPDDPLLPRGACDVVLVVNTFHHVPDRAAWLQRLTRALKPGGRIANVDFHKHELPLGPPPEHKISREEFLSDAARAGLKPVAEHRFLPHQYFVVLAPASKR